MTQLELLLPSGGGGFSSCEQPVSSVVVLSAAAAASAGANIPFFRFNVVIVIVSLHLLFLVSHLESCWKGW